MTSFDPIRLEIFKHLLAAVAEEMGVILKRSSYSPNIKERRDFSCAVFDSSGRLVSQAAHIPVHLGSMSLSVEQAVSKFQLSPGDMVILNDPYLGGTHLPDITLIAPVYYQHELAGYVANRAHHADVGGMVPGSMPIATEIFQEGLIIPPVLFMEKGTVNQSILDLILANVRTPEERRGDLLAQVAANQRGIDRFIEICTRYSLSETTLAMNGLLAYTEQLTRRMLEQIPSGNYEFLDYLDNDGSTSEPIPIKVKVEINGDSAVVDFTGSAPQRPTSLNAVYAITLSAVFYVFRSLLGLEAPNNSGCMAPVKIIAPYGSILNAAPPAPVAAGNVEVSQRIVDVLLGALSQACPEKIPAASQGTMNNITLGGMDPRGNTPFTYYETIGGGTGACAAHVGTSAVHSHMTNTLNTPIEALEYAYPLQVRRYQIRRGTGGAGAYPGGDGIIREIQVLTDAQGTILSDRRETRPYGLQGGLPGVCGENFILRGSQNLPLPGKTNLSLQKGDILCIHTPGGGGYGKPPGSST